MGKVDTIAFDKTGTLTYGKLEVSDVLSFSSELSKDKLLYLAASAEAKSEHPIGKGDRGVCPEERSAPWRIGGVQDDLRQRYLC